MAKKTFSDRINGLFRKSDWKTARKLLEDERENDPKSHWLLTQLGVTFYEQRRYRDSLQLFLASQRIKDDCPLTLWHLAGAYDAIGEHRKAIKTFSRLLQSKTSPEKDPCWESKQWTDKLKTNVVYRLGVCFQHLGENDLAERWYRRYLDLLLRGGEGMYSIDDVTSRIRGLHRAGGYQTVGGELRKAAKSAIQISGTQLKNGRRKMPVNSRKENRLAGRRSEQKIVPGPPAHAHSSALAILSARRRGRCRGTHRLRGTTHPGVAPGRLPPRHLSLAHRRCPRGHPLVFARSPGDHRVGPLSCAAALAADLPQRAVRRHAGPGLRRRHPRLRHVPAAAADAPG